MSAHPVWEDGRYCHANTEPRAALRLVGSSQVSTPVRLGQP